MYTDYALEQGVYTPSQKLFKFVTVSLWININWEAYDLLSEEFSHINFYLYLGNIICYH